MNERKARAGNLKFSLRASLEWLFAREWRLAHWVVAVLWLAALLALQWELGHGFITQTNQDWQQSDQSAYLDLARSNVGFVWPVVTDGIRGPLFPFLIKTWASSDEAQFFAAAKLANVYFGLGATALFAVFFLWKLPLLPAMNVGTVSALIILPASVFATSEVVYYTAFFFLWIVGWRLLVENPLKRYALAGVLCAVAYLAKPSTLLFGICLVALSLARWIQVQRSRDFDGMWSGPRFVVGAVVFYLSFLLPVLPKAIDTWRRAGDPFENASQYCFWMDNWHDCLPKMRYFSARHITELPKEERPSLENYWRTHTIDQMWNRLSYGMAAQGHNCLLAEKSWKAALKSYPKLRTVLPVRGAYPLALLVATLLLATQRGTVKSRTLIDRRALWALAAIGFAVHFLAFSFYTPIAGGDRFILGIYIPILFSLAMGLEYLREERPSGWRVDVVQGIHLLIGAQLIWQLIRLSAVTTFGELRGAI